MSISPGVYNISLQRRADYSLALQFKDSTGSAINLTGTAVTAQAWDKSRTTKYADFTITYVDRMNGEVTIELTDAQTTGFPESLNYDVLLTSSGGLKSYYLEGKITVSEGYSA